MDRINLKQTDRTPNVNFDINKGELQISGRSFPEDPRSFYKDVLENVKNVKSKLNIKLHFEYLNTSSTKVILEMLKEAKRRNGLNVTWVSDEDDVEMAETGQYFSELADVPFNFELVPEE